MPKPKKTVSAKLPEDMVSEVERLEEEHDLSQSDALRRLIRNGIEYEKKQQKNQAEYQGLFLMAAIAGIAGVIGITSGEISFSLQINSGWALLLMSLVFATAGSYVKGRQ